MVIFVICGRND